MFWCGRERLSDQRVTDAYLSLTMLLCHVKRLLPWQLVSKWLCKRFLRNHKHERRQPACGYCSSHLLPSLLVTVSPARTSSPSLKTCDLLFSQVFHIDVQHVKLTNPFKLLVGCLHSNQSYNCLTKRLTMQWMILLLRSCGSTVNTSSHLTSWMHQ